MTVTSEDSDEPVAGAPTRERPPGLEVGCAWVPTVDPERAEGSVKLHFDFAKAQAGFVFHVARALSAVPDTANQFFAAFSLAALRQLNKFTFGFGIASPSAHFIFASATVMPG